MLTCDKNCSFLFLSERRHGTQMAEIVCYIYIFHRTWPVSLHYLAKRGCAKFLPNTEFSTVRLLRLGVNVKSAYCRDNFLAYRPLPDMRIVPGWVFYVSTGRHPSALKNTKLSFSRSERETWDTSSSKHLCPCLWCTFRAQILTILSRSVMATNNSAK